MTIQVSSSDNAQQQPSVVANNNTAITTATDDNNNNNSNSSSVPATESAVRRLLRPIGTTPPPFDVFPVIEHPFPPIYADAAVYKDNAVPTCSWLSNLFYPSVENRAPTTPDPYILRFLDPVGDHPGVSISQPHDKVIGSYPAVNNVPPTPAGYMINGVTVDFRITANEWTQAKKPTMKVKDWDLFGAKLQLLSSGSAAAAGMEIPLARGTPFITARYQALTPQFYSQHAIVNIQSVNGTSNNSAEATYQGTKFKMTFNDNPASTYLIYALNGPLTLRKVDTNNLVATGTYNGTVQIAKLPRPEDESVLDAHSGVWAVGAQLDATTNKQQYTIRWKLEGDMSKTLLTYAYPHHLKSFASSARIEKTPLILQSSTKGAMQAVIGNTWTLEEPDLPTAINWFPQNAAVTDPATRNDILGVLEDDILESNYTEHTQRGDNYFSGKGLQKFALLALLLNHPEVTQFNDPVLAQTALDKLKESFVPYLENRQEDPFLYDTMYKGIVAKKGLPESMGGTGDRNAEFGHAYYNDHHYHQGYLIVTAAMIHYMDPTWRAEELKTWTETLIRDVNNPVEEEDVYFAPFRNWDWFAGHSWAGGIKVDGAMDGRDQESVPEVREKTEPHLVNLK
ncbi:endo-1,3(4)-beta-glucanase [Mycotypha africana]|uniref:endo-1,3(4)-beta-glucanase n=1 Tax=Mycotypha africana TaxID=64632 RepID=UPI002301F255|nr:endo-1,3(4)-beta-glucanase [Mycotypha africana]KAI8984748.1 endo-1,3(4)-beta-glucanase [Mycotypha africana]